jgi:uncharacterized C2H2 Zn-finger protein
MTIDVDARRAYMQHYFKEHGHKYKRSNLLRTAMRRGRLPTQACIERHKFTKEELQPIIERILGAPTGAIPQNEGFFFAAVCLGLRQIFMSRSRHTMSAAAMLTCPRCQKVQRDRYNLDRHLEKCKTPEAQVAEGVLERLHTLEQDNLRIKRKLEEISHAKAKHAPPELAFDEEPEPSKEVVNSMLAKPASAVRTYLETKNLSYPNRTLRIPNVKANDLCVARRTPTGQVKWRTEDLQAGLENIAMHCVSQLCDAHKGQDHPHFSKWVGRWQDDDQGDAEMKRVKEDLRRAIIDAWQD